MTPSNYDFITFLKKNSNISKNGSIKFKGAAIRSAPMWAKLKDKYSFLNEVETMLPYEFLFCLEHNIQDQPRCKTCGNEIPFKIERSKIPHYLKTFCNLKCFNQNPEKNKINSEREKRLASVRLDKRKETISKKYGSWDNRPGKDNFAKANNRLKSDIIFKEKRSEKIRDTNILKHGVDHQMKIEKVASERRKLADKTCLEKYGVTNPMKVPEFKENSLPKYINKELYKKINKCFLEREYIEDGFASVNRLKEDLNCSLILAYKLFSRYDVKFKHRFKKGGFQPDKEATLYYIYDPKEDLYKIGITNRTLEDRFSKSFLDERQIEILEEINYSSGEDAYLAEQEILEAFSPYRCTNNSWPEDKGGKTEFFNKDILELRKGVKNDEIPSSI